jgi:hypothetical protein
MLKFDDIDELKKIIVNACNNWKYKSPVIQTQQDVTIDPNTLTEKDRKQIEYAYSWGGRLVNGQYDYYQINQMFHQHRTCSIVFHYTYGKQGSYFELKHRIQQIQNPQDYQLLVMVICDLRFMEQYVEMTKIVEDLKVYELNVQRIDFIVTNRWSKSVKRVREWLENNVGPVGSDNGSYRSYLLQLQQKQQQEEEEDSEEETYITALF